LSPGQDSWGAAYSAFILAKQAGADIAFRYPGQKLGDPSVILVPSLCGQNHLNRRCLHELRERAAAGATVYISIADAIISGFSDLTGLEIAARERRNSPLSFRFTEHDEPFQTGAEFRSGLKSMGAKILGAEPDGNPAFACFDIGKGRVYFLSFPLELALAGRPGAFHHADASPFWHIYARIFSHGAGRVVSRDLPAVGMTEHPLDSHRRIAVLVNYAPEEAKTRLTLAKGWEIGETLYGNSPAGDECRAILRPNDALVLTINSRR
jgi:hypothetical protein